WQIRGQDVAVIVDAIAGQLSGPRVHGGICVVAVGAIAGERQVAVAIVIDTPRWAVEGIVAIDESIAVVVDTVAAMLGGVGVDEWVVVVAVGTAASDGEITVAVGVGAVGATLGDVVKVDEPVAVVV